MKKNILRYLKHVILTILVLIIVGFIVIISIGGSVHYGDHPQMTNLDREGPYIFYKNDSTLDINYIRGNKEDGFYTEQRDFSIDSSIIGRCHFPLDSTDFDFIINPHFKTPKAIYQDHQPVLAVSDIESGYRTFRDFLMQHKVIDQGLKWTFGKGHLVLVGDFVDRGYSTTQVLWFIYKIEQEALLQGGMVHYILGNHELKNMQGKYESAAPKYYGVASILGKQPHELYAPYSFLGKWISSKNSLELINGQLFVHGGIHPDVASMNLDIDDINDVVRQSYYHPYYPKTEKNDEQLLISNRIGIAWYRGYFKEDLKQEQIDNILKKFNAQSIVVGHTLQSKVNRQFNGKVIAIDVHHPKDYHKNFPHHDSEGLLIENGEYFRLLHDGTRKKL